MTRPIHPVQPSIPAEVRAPKHRWITDGETMNPAPQQRERDGRDTALGCRDRATADLLQALAASTANGRRVLETSAASWTLRAELLQRIETGIEARLEGNHPGAPQLTPTELAEDAAHLRL